MRESQIISYVEEGLGVLWGMLGLLAWNRGLTILVWICGIQFTVSETAAIIYAIKGKMERQKQTEYPQV